MTPLRGIILDFDGVIVESNALKTEAFEAVFSRYPEHASAMMAHHHAHVSQSRFAKFEHLVYERLGRPGDRALVEALAAEFAGLLHDRMTVCPFVPGAEAFLEEFAPLVPLTLASVTPEPELLPLLERRGLAAYFAQVFACPPWTKADAVGAVVKASGGAAHLALVGDSAGDQAAAARWDVEFIPRDSGLPFDPPVPAYPDLHAIAALVRPRIA